MSDYIVLTDDDYPGRARIVPSHWKAIVGDEWTQDPMTAFDSAGFWEDELGTVHLEWKEDETYETFEAAVNAAGYVMTGNSDDGDYAAWRM